jgi:hypothetical protein
MPPKGETKRMPIIPEKQKQLRHVVYMLDGKEHIISEDDYTYLKETLSDKDEFYKTMQGALVTNENTDNETIILMKNLCAIGKRVQEV